MKNYKTTITFYYQAKNDNEALGLADSIADRVEQSTFFDTGKIDAVVGTPNIIGDDK